MAQHSHNINQSKSNGWKMTDKSNSTKPWFSICRLNDIPRGPRTVPRHYPKAKEWVVPQLLEWSSHSLAYEITEPLKLTTPHSMATTLTLFDGPHSCSVFLSESEQIYFLPITVSHWSILQWDIRNLSFIRSWNQAPWVWLGSSPGWTWLSD